MIVNPSVNSSTPAPKQRNSKDENEAIKAGKTPQEWEKKPAKNAQKDKDARWTKKHGKSFYGYKNHIGVDKLHKIIRKWAATDASPHDSRMRTTPAARCGPTAPTARPRSRPSSRPGA